MFEAFVYWLRRSGLFHSRGSGKVTISRYSFPAVPLGEDGGKNFLVEVECHEQKVTESWFSGLMKLEYDKVTYYLVAHHLFSGPDFMVEQKIPGFILFYGHLNGTSTKRWLQCNLVLIRNGTFQSTPSVRIYSNDFLKSGNFPEGPAG